MNGRKAKNLRKIVKLSKSGLPDNEYKETNIHYKLYGPTDSSTQIKVSTTKLTQGCRRYFYKALKTAYKLSMKTTKKFNLSETL